MTSSKSICAALSIVAALALPAGAAMAQQSGASLQDRLGKLLSGPSAESQLLDPDQAFKLSVSASGPQQLSAELVPANGYYLYRDKIRFSLRDAKGITIKSVKLPAGEMKADQTFGKTEVYTRTVPAVLALERKGGARNLTLVTSYQGCNEKLGVCYPPVEKSVGLVLPQ